MEPNLPASQPPRSDKKNPARNVWARTQFLVEVLLTAMEDELSGASDERNEQWMRMFGAKDGAVVQLQKLVDLLVELQRQKPVSKRRAREPKPNDDEVAMLKDWVRAQDAASAANASPAAE